MKGPRLDYLGNDLWVVRDDLVPGGTKAAVLPQVLDAIGAGSVVTYATPAYGYAQVALAHAAAATGRRAVVFVAGRKDKHPRTTEAEAAGAEIVEVRPGYLTVVQASQRRYCEEFGASLLPFGLDVAPMREAITARASSISIVKPEVVWCAAGSGTLSRSLQEAFPNAEHNAVQVGRLPDVANASLHTAPEKFEQRAELPPPYPSCTNYDAKVWRYIKPTGRTTLVWNVAA